VLWVAEAISLELGQQLDPFTGSEAPSRGQALKVRFSGIVSVGPLGKISCLEFVIRGGRRKEIEFDEKIISNYSDNINFDRLQR